MDIQQTLFDDLYEPLKIMKPIRLIELFAGYGSQSLALNYLGADYESHRICEWNYKSFHAYRLMHSIDVGVDYSEGHSDDEVLEFLIGSGVSADWNKPMTEQQIRKLPLGKRREIYSDIIATRNLVDVSKAHARDLGMTDRDKYCYVMTYSFPCQDLSLSGKCLGMEKGSGTRSGLLWEVERILRECGDNRPDILLMENVTQVHGQKNDKDWQKWLLSLESMGYVNYWKDMNAVDYGIPQTRERCFMVSICGEFCYTFPKPSKCVLVEKDFLEEHPLSKYILSDHAVSFWKEREKKMIERGNGFRFKVTNGEGYARTILTAPGSRMDDNYVYVEPKLHDFLEDCVNEKYYLTDEQISHIRAWDSRQGEKIDNDTIIGGMQEHQSVRHDGTCTTIPTCGGGQCPMVAVKGTLQIAQLYPGSGNPQSSRIYDDRGKSPCLDTCTGGNRMPKIAIKDGTEPYEGLLSYDEYNKKVHDEGTIGTIQTDSSSPNHNWKVGDGLRIRKLTPRECFRLMGVRDEDFDRIKDDFSDSALYHLAGDSIVVNVLMAIFGEML